MKTVFHGLNTGLRWIAGVAVALSLGLGVIGVVNHSASAAATTCTDSNGAAGNWEVKSLTTDGTYVISNTVSALATCGIVSLDNAMLKESVRYVGDPTMNVTAKVVGSELHLIGDGRGVGLGLEIKLKPINPSVDWGLTLRLVSTAIPDDGDPIYLRRVNGSPDQTLTPAFVMPAYGVYTACGDRCPKQRTWGEWVVKSVFTSTVVAITVTANITSVRIYVGLNEKGEWPNPNDPNDKDLILKYKVISGASENRVIVLVPARLQYLLIRVIAAPGETDVIGVTGPLCPADDIRCP